jgi:NitT/TauT family transport system ATP-binding protein
MADSALLHPAAATPTARATVITAEKLNVIFSAADQPVIALADVNLTVDQGDFVSLIGPSGCGKTTLLRAIADLAPITTGTLTVNGMTPSEARIARAYGYVFQAPALFPWRNVIRNVTLPLELTGMSKAERERCAMENLTLLGLKDFGRKFPWQLSGGMQQRVSIARALSFKPELLLMDEPFGALDEITRDNLNLHLHQLWAQTALSAVFVTHSIPEAVFLSTRIVVMSARPGRVLRVIDSKLPRNRTLDMRETPEFIAVAHEVREALREGHSYD